MKFSQKAFFDFYKWQREHYQSNAPLEPYLCKVNSFTFGSAGKWAKRGGPVEGARRRATKRNPVYYSRSVSTKPGFQNANPETALCHISYKNDC